MSRSLRESEINDIISANQNRVRLEKISSCPISEYQTNSYSANSPCEDRHAEVTNLSGSYFGVYDGHGGVHAANFVKEVLISYIQHYIQQVLVAESENFNLLSAMPTALSKAYVEADREFLLSGVLDELKLANVYTGACANNVIVMGRHVFVANAGDCRAVLGKWNSQRKQWQSIQLSSDHTAATEESRLRREHPDEPDVVRNGTIKGNLEPSRAFGDALYKDVMFNNYLRAEFRMPEPFKPPYVTAKPEVYSRLLQNGDSFIVLATDGLWDRLSNDEVVQIIANHDRTTDGNVCNVLIKKVLERSAKFGKTPEEKISYAIQLPQKEKRRHHDDITITVIYLDQSRFPEMNDFKLIPENLRPNPFHIKQVRNMLHDLKTDSITANFWKA